MMSEQAIREALNERRSMMERQELLKQLWKLTQQGDGRIQPTVKQQHAMSQHSTKSDVAAGVAKP